MSDQPNRRKDDPRIEQLVKDVDELKAGMKQVTDILTSFRLVGTAAKWLTLITTAFTAGIGLIVAAKSGFDIFFKR